MLTSSTDKRLAAGIYTSNGNCQSDALLSKKGTGLVKNAKIYYIS